MLSAVGFVYTWNAGLLADLNHLNLERREKAPGRGFAVRWQARLRSRDRRSMISRGRGFVASFGARAQLGAMQATSLAEG